MASTYTGKQTGNEDI